MFTFDMCTNKFYLLIFLSRIDGIVSEPLRRIGQLSVPVYLPRSGKLWIAKEN